MQKSIKIFAVALIAVAALSAWTLTQRGADARQKFSTAASGGINILDLTRKAKDLPVQQFDAH